MRTQVFSLALASCLVLFPGANALASKKGSGPAAKPPLKAEPSLGIDVTAIDPSVDPCDNFYEYACGKWIQRTQIPEDKPQWMRSFSEIQEKNEKALRKILEDLAAGKPSQDPYGDKLGNFWSTCMAEDKIEASSDAELKKVLARVETVTDPTSLAKVVAEMHLGLGNPMFAFRSEQDFQDATQVIGVADQAGLGLPDRDYYLKDDPKMKELRAQYLGHVRRMFGLAGVPEAQAEKDAETVLRIETHLAEASMARVDRRDPKKIYHRLELKGLESTSPRFPWGVYLAALGHPEITKINVAVPDFFAKLSTEIEKTPLADWKTYLRWHTIHAAAPMLGKKLVDEDFAFFGKTLQGTDKLMPRWKRCVAFADRALGEALARPFVRDTFGEEGKAATIALVKQVEAAMEADLQGLKWMDEATKQGAFAKLHAIANKIGFPDHWRNYDALEIGRDSFLENQMRAEAFESRRDLDKIGKPLDRSEWLMTPPTVNAYYEPSLNEMVFPAGILQPPFYDRAAHPAVNFGAVGMVMGHELTHGFDDEGRKFDEKGNLRDWWTPTVGSEFEKRAECVAKQYDGYVAVDDVHVNGHLTLGENIADLGGIKLAYAAYQTMKKPSPDKRFTDSQLFFLGTAQAWCGKRRPEIARLRAATDPHSPPEHRINGPLSNLPEFAAAFQCKAGAKMNRPEPCHVW